MEQVQPISLADEIPATTPQTILSLDGQIGRARAGWPKWRAERVSALEPYGQFDS